jgi:4-amino-4-deoxy-L-arabinose transferase-like glycosyltransferase
MMAMKATSVCAGAPDEREHAWYATGLAVVLYIAAARLLLLLLTASRYGYFGDELYFLACSEHLDWGYVDMPPLLPLLTRIERAAGGDSLLSLRFLPALAGSAKVVLTGLTARELGARRFGMALAATASAVAIVYLGIDHLLTMNAFEPVLWMGCAYVLIRLIKTGNEKLWLWFGLLAGLGLENKYSILVFGFGIFIALLVTPERRFLRSRWFWLGGALAFLIFLPNLVWNVRHHFPFVELTRNIAASGRDIRPGPLDYLWQQMLMLSPLIFPVWLVGLLFLLLGREGRRYRLLGWTYLVALAVFMGARSKNYYLAPAYPMLLAAGAVWIERVRLGRAYAWLKPVGAVVMAAGSLVFAPIMLPVLSPEQYLRYQETLPFALPATERSHMAALLPHHYAWQFGWEEMVAAVARVYNSLPPEERAKTAIAAENYAEAGAIDLWGPRYGLPKAISGHMNYWLWGPRNYTGETLIVIGGRLKDLQQYFGEVQAAAPLHNPYARPSENRPVLLCRRPRINLQQVWPKVKNWD